MSQLQTGLADINGAKLYYEVDGQGEPLLLLHAGVADSRMWDDQFGVLAQHYRVIRYDLRGFGRSNLPAGLFSNHEDVAGLLNFLGVEQAHVIGISFGGHVALDFTLTYPERVKTLVLGAPAVSGHPPSPEIQRFGAEEESLLERGDVAAATELNLRMWVDGPHRTSDQVDPTIREQVREMQAHAFTIPIPEDAAEQPIEPPAISRLAEVRPPTLILIGDLDVPYMTGLADQLAAEIPGARQEMIPGVAHLLNMEKPEVFNRLVLDFLRQH